MSDAPINLNLDQLERKVIPPYRFAVGEQVFEFTDPALLDWRKVERMTTLDALAEHCMSDEDRKAFYDTPLASYKLGLLFDDVQRHFELGEYAPTRR